MHLMKYIRTFFYVRSFQTWTIFECWDFFLFPISGSFFDLLYLQFFDGNLLRGIDICLGAALKAVRHLLTTSFSNNFSLFGAFKAFQLLQTMLAIYDLPFRIFFWKIFICKNLIFEPSCYVIKSVLLRREYKEELF